MNEKYRVFKRSKEFSANIIKKLKGYKELKNVYICGSILRREALPMSDADLMYFGKHNKKIGCLKIDKIDRIDNIALKSKFAKRLLTCMSPESGFLDSKPLLSGKKNHFYFKIYNNKQHLINRFVWEYNYRFFNERSNNKGYNLKYSVGAYRDILLINLFGRFLKEKINHDKPEILGSIKKIRKVIKYDYKKLLESIKIIMLTKSIVLLAHSLTDTRGRTQLTKKTLKEAFRYDGKFAGVTKNNLKEFWNKYLESKKCLKSFLDEIYKYINTNHKDLYYNYIAISLKIIKNGSKRFIESVLDQKVGDTFPVLTSIIFNENCSKKILKKIARKYSNDVGHYCTNRLIAKSTKTDNKTLIFMLRNSRFALDDWTNERYKSIIKNRLKK